MNRITLMGRLTKDPEVRCTKNEKTVSKFTVAVNRERKDQPTDFFNVTAWNKLAEISSLYLKKGDRVLLEGQMQLNRYEKDGKVTTFPEVLVEKLHFIESKKDKETAAASKGEGTIDFNDFTINDIEAGGSLEF